LKNDRCGAESIDDDRFFFFSFFFRGEFFFSGIIVDDVAQNASRFIFRAIIIVDSSKIEEQIAARGRDILLFFL